MKHWKQIILSACITIVLTGCISTKPLTPIEDVDTVHPALIMKGSEEIEHSQASYFIGDVEIKRVNKTGFYKMFYFADQQYMSNWYRLIRFVPGDYDIRFAVSQYQSGEIDLTMEEGRIYRLDMDEKTLKSCKTDGSDLQETMLLIRY
ncbi:MAG: hypothetical protein PQJ58_07970 [Spirochaetales bacterium]|nr:hypothetical protein [Spirochaetales bacterium]